MLNKITRVLQVLINILLFIIGVWIVLYAFEKNLPSLIGADLFVKIYNLVSSIISVAAVLVVILTILYAIIIFVNKKDS